MERLAGLRLHPGPKEKKVVEGATSNFAESFLRLVTLRKMATSNIGGATSNFG